MVRHHHHHRRVIQINLINLVPVQIAVWIPASFLPHLFLHHQYRLPHRRRRHPSSGACPPRSTQCSAKHAVVAEESWAGNARDKTTPVVRHHHHHRRVIQINLFNLAPVQIAVWIPASVLLHLFLHLQHRLPHRHRHHPSSRTWPPSTTQCSTKPSHRPDATHQRPH
jgi:hypothetical protein